MPAALLMGWLVIGAAWADGVDEGSLDGVDLDIEAALEGARADVSEQRVTLRVGGGYALFHEPLYDLEFGAFLPLRADWILAVEAGAWIGMAPRMGDPEPLVYALLPVTVGAGVRMRSSDRVRPYGVASLLALTWFKDAAKRLPEVAPGLQARAGLEVPMGDHLGLFGDATAGFAWTRDIDTRVQAHYHDLWYTLGARIGLAVAL